MWRFWVYVHLMKSTHIEAVYSYNTPFPKNGSTNQNRGHGMNRKPLILWCRGTESNCRHGDFQSPALPTELPRPKLDFSINEISYL